jgi:hypothetical protein
MSDPAPFDEISYLRLLERMRDDQERGAGVNVQDLCRFLHLTPQLIAENIRLRERSRRAVETAALLEQGQRVLPFSVVVA